MDITYHHLKTLQSRQRPLRWRQDELDDYWKLEYHLAEDRAS